MSVDRDPIVDAVARELIRIDTGDQVPDDHPLTDDVGRHVVEQARRLRDLDLLRIPASDDMMERAETVVNGVLPLAPDTAQRVVRKLAKAGLLGDQPQVIHVHHHDIESHARSFNEGFDEAMALRWPVLGWLRRWFQ